VGQSITFGASASSDPDGTITGYSWSFGDGSRKNYRMSFTPPFAKEGTSRVRLTVTDDEGASSSVGQDVKVLQSGPEAAVGRPRLEL
jgi:PKD repeat protein